MKEDLFAEYPNVPSQQWHEKILKDLKVRSLEEMYWSPDQEIRLNPYIHAEDVPVTIQGIAHFGNWKIGESFLVLDEKESNKQILESLQGGVEAVRIKGERAMNWEQLFHGVQLSLLHIGLDVPENYVQEFLTYASGKHSLQDLNITLYTSGMKHQSVRYCNAPENSVSIIDGLVSIITERLNALDGDYSRCSLCDLSTHAGMHYLVEIARLRALRILWKNLSSALGFEIPSSFAIEAHISQESANYNPEQQMIRNTVKTLAAVLGGADRIYFENAVSSEKQTATLQRISRNIHHLLRYESKMTEMEDPIAGAYYIDKLTQEIVDKTWEMLLQTIRKEDE